MTEATKPSPHLVASDHNRRYPSEYSSPEKCRAGCARVSDLVYEFFRHELNETQQWEVRQAAKTH